ncbi:MAG: hypothetical protein KY459_01515 [Acidobacteria bacterium]|nr:hypothetical protein [Acidobacteriota bacterium]
MSESERTFQQEFTEVTLNAILSYIEDFRGYLDGRDLDWDAPVRARHLAWMMEWKGDEARPVYRWLALPGPETERELRAALDVCERDVRSRFTDGEDT